MNSFFEVIDLSAGYEKTQRVTNVSFTMEKGMLCCILGANGCGKTTLLRAIMKSGVWVKGRCYLQGKNILEMPPKLRARQVAMLPQILTVPEGLLVEDVLEMGYYPQLSLFQSVTDQMRLEISQRMERFGLKSLRTCYFNQLSQGQKQMVLYVRTLIQNTPIICMDEPDSALDFQHKHQMFLSLRDLVYETEKAVLLILHDPGIALTYCDKVLLMKNGKIIEELEPNQESPEDLEQKLQLLYPNIKVARHKPAIQVWYEQNRGD